MLKLICDHCGFEIKLIHTLIHKKEDVDGDGNEYRFYWEISSEQEGIGYTSPPNKYFDRDPNGLDKWNWNNNVGTYDEDSIRGHYCASCKEEYKKYLQDYESKSISLDNILKDKDLSSVEKLKTTANELKKLLHKDYDEYKSNFIRTIDVQDTT